MRESLARSASRSLGLVLFAAIINTAIFIGMQALVGNREVRLADTRNFELANFIRMTETAPPVKSRRDPPPPKPSAEPRPEIEPLAGATRSSGSGPALAQAMKQSDSGRAADLLGRLEFEDENWGAAMAALARARHQGSLESPQQTALLLGIAALREQSFQTARAPLEAAAAHADTANQARYWLSRLE